MQEEFKMTAVIEYMWIKIFKDIDGVEKFIPQFRDDGTQQLWSETSNIKPHKLVISPISPVLAKKMQDHNIPGCSVKLPTYNFYLLPEDDVKAYWDNEISVTSHFKCRTCGHCWLHMDSSKWAKCPACGESDVWSCRRCDRSNIDNSLVHRNNKGEVNCPYCEIPYGLNRQIMLDRIQDVIENTDYVIEISNKIKIIIRKDTVDTYSLSDQKEESYLTE